MKEEERQIDRKLLDALERLGEAFRYLKSDIAREYGVSNLQMRVMTHLIQCPEKEPSNSELAREFGIARATLGEVIQKLREKGWVQRERSSRDRRKYGLKTTRKGEALAGELSSYMSTLEAPLSKVGRSEKEALLHSTLSIIHGLIQRGVINTQRMCYTCRFYRQEKGKGYCDLLELVMEEPRVDCKTHQSVEA